jgi:hypothetical protein
MAAKPFTENHSSRFYAFNDSGEFAHRINPTRLVSSR